MRNDISLVDLARATDRLAEKEDRITQLGICSMSEELIRAPIELALEYDFPVLFIASRNQVSDDEGGGYVMGLTPETFIQKILEVEDSLKLNSESSPDYIRFVSIDHCGPWYKEREKKLGEEEAIGRLYNNLKKNDLLENPEAYVMKAVKKAIMRYVDAFNLGGSTSKMIEISKMKELR